SLRVQPLPHVALGRVRALGELCRCERPDVPECAVETELVADHDERRVQCRADLVHGAEDELLELRAVDRFLLDRSHDLLLPSIEEERASRTLRKGSANLAETLSA